MNDFLRRQSVAVWGLMASALVLGLGYIDYLSGPEISFSVFYFLPIFAISWYSGRAPGVVISFLSAAIWLAADYAAGQRYSYEWVAIWNCLVRLIMFLTMAALIARIKILLEHEITLSKTDPLTSLRNRRAFYDALEQESERSKRYNSAFTIAYIDLDNFKMVNDTRGHSEGDRVLKRVAGEMLARVRKTDFVARLGGDELALLFPETDADAARSAIEKLTAHLLRAMREEGWPVTFSVGVVTFRVPMASVLEMIGLSDKLMYEVKKGGKNRASFLTYEGEPLDPSAG